MNWFELNQVFTNSFDKSMQFLEFKEGVDSRFLSTGPVGMSLRENDQVLLRFASRRVRRNMTASDLQVVCDSWCFPEDIYDLPPEHEYEFDGGEELLFVSAKQVRESVKDEDQVFVILALLEAKCNEVVCDLRVVCEFL